MLEMPPRSDDRDRGGKFVIIQADARQLPIASGAVQCVVTSPPYWGLRDYGIPGQLGLEASPEEYVANMVAVFREVRRVLRDDGTLWLNIGDSYSRAPEKGGSGPGNKGNRHIDDARRIMSESNGSSDGKVGRADRAPVHVGGLGLKPKDLVGIPWRVAVALQADGWYLRSDIIWSKPNPMPESVTDRPTKAHEYLFLLAKSERYFYNADAIKEPASLDTHARYARGRSDNHKWTGGGPGDQTIARTFEHMRLGKEGPNSRMHVNRDPQHEEEQTHRRAGVHPKAAPAGSGIRANESFSAAVKDIVSDRNKRSVWTIATQPYSGAHFATFPEKLVETCLLAGSRPGDIVFDPFVGSGTVIRVATRLQRRGVGCDLNWEYLRKQATERASKVQVEMQYESSSLTPSTVTK